MSVQISQLCTDRKRTVPCTDGKHNGGSVHYRGPHVDHALRHLWLLKWPEPARGCDTEQAFLVMQQVSQLPSNLDDVTVWQRAESPDSGPGGAATTMSVGSQRRVPGTLLPGVSLVARAEQALLGAVLSDPPGQGHVLDLVDADDMARPYHAQVLAAMKWLRDRGAEPEPLAVYAELANDPDLPRSVSHDGVLIADLLEASPRPGHAPAYAAMVVSPSVRRRAALAASRMAQAAESGDTESALEMAAQARRELGECRARWESLPAPVRRELPTRTRHGGWAGIARRLAGVRDEIRALREELGAGQRDGVEERLALIAGHLADAALASASRRERHRVPLPHVPRRSARPETEEVESDQRAEAVGVAGERVLQDLAAGPSQIGVVRDWLRPEHFANPAHGEVYALMRDMAAAGKPVDPVTIAWEADARGLAVDAADLDGGTAAFAVPSAREVHRQWLLAEAVRAGRDIQAHAVGPGPPLPAFLRESERRLDQIQPSPHAPTANHHRLPGRDCARAAVPRQVQPVHDTTPEATR